MLSSLFSNRPAVSRDVAIPVEQANRIAQNSRLASNLPQEASRASELADVPKLSTNNDHNHAELMTSDVKAQCIPSRMKAGQLLVRPPTSAQKADFVVHQDQQTPSARYGNIKSSPTRARKAVDESRETALLLYKTYEEDLETFVLFFEARESFTRSDIAKVELVFIPHMKQMRDYFIATNDHLSVPVNMSQLKDLILRLHEFQICIDAKKDDEMFSFKLRKELSHYRVQIKAAANAMCVRAMLPAVCSPIPSIEAWEHSDAMQQPGLNTAARHPSSIVPTRATKYKDHDNWRYD